MGAFCRDCMSDQTGTAGSAELRCNACGSPRVVAHPELESLSIAHIDCDAFYAAVEKRDRPELRDRPVIVGGGRRGVVMAACYIARLSGVHSAMPMFKAQKACPKAVVIRPNMAKYQAVGRQVRELMRDVTPLVEPLSIDEAFLDLSGTQRLHRRSPAQSLGHLVRRIEEELKVTASVGLSYNKYLAKVASDLDKPRGFSVIGRAEAKDFLGPRSVSLIWGVGKALKSSLARHGILLIGDLWRFEEAELIALFGAMGRRLYAFSRGQDSRSVNPDMPAKSISAETTFDRDIAEAGALAAELWPLSEKVSARLKRAGLAGATLTLKLKTAEFALVSRSRKLAEPTCLAEEIYRAALSLLQREANGRHFRLIGVGLADLAAVGQAGLRDLFDPEKSRRAQVEAAIDAVRAKLGPEAIKKGRGFARTTPPQGPPQRRTRRI